MELELQTGDPRLLEVALALCRAVARAGGEARFVGGTVRDALLGREIEDVDIEVRELPVQQLIEVLQTEHELDLVGESFGVVRLKRWPIDVSLPRRESKSGRGHRGFLIASDPWLDEREAAARRDFTINSMAWEPLGGRLVDPFDGLADLRSRRLRHTSARFVEDPLRVLRGCQLVARFELEPDDATVRLCRAMEPEGLATERVGVEWDKLLLRGVRIGSGLAFLRATRWLRHFPELLRLVGCVQDPRWHPEGDVWEHTLHVLDAFAAERVGDREEDLVVGLACLAHDLGKPGTTFWRAGHWRSPGHEQAGTAPTLALLARLSPRRRLDDEVLPLVQHHLKPRQLYEARAGDAAVRRLSRKVGRIDRLVRVARADAAGRPPHPAGHPDGFAAEEWLLESARRLEVAAAAPAPLVLGRHVLARGLAPGPAVGRLLERCYRAQLAGRFQDLEGGLAHLDRLLARRGTMRTDATAPGGEEAPSSQRSRRRGRRST